jgi:hypothetical protein
VQKPVRKSLSSPEEEKGSPFHFSIFFSQWLILKESTYYPLMEISKSVPEVAGGYYPNLGRAWAVGSTGSIEGVLTWAGKDGKQGRYP